MSSRKPISETKPTKRFYVYTLGHPNGMIFYVGKGSGNRPQHHLCEARGRDCYCAKCKIIRKIWKEHLEVEIECVFESDSEKEVRTYERDLIYKLQRDYP